MYLSVMLLGEGIAVEQDELEPLFHEMMWSSSYPMERIAHLSWDPVTLVRGGCIIRIGSGGS